MDNSRDFRLFYPHGFFGPGVKLLRQVKFGTKSLIITLAFLLPIIVLALQFMQTKSEQIAFAATERAGAVVLLNVSPLSASVSRVRNATRAGLGGVQTLQDFNQARNDVDAAIKSLEQTLSDSGDPLNLRPAVAEFRAAWEKTAQFKSGVNAEGHTVFGDVNVALVQLMGQLAERSNLTLDPDTDSFYLASALIIEGPDFIENTGQVWGWSAYATGSGKTTAAQKAKISGWFALASASERRIQKYLQYAFAANPSLKGGIDASGLDKVRDYLRRAQARAQQADGAEPRDAMALYEEGRELQPLLARYTRDTTQSLVTLLDHRLSSMKTARNTEAGISILLVLLGFYLFYCFYLTNKGGLDLIRRHLDEISEGDLRNRPQEPWGRDEPAELMLNLARTYESLHNLIRRVRHSARELGHTSQEVSQGSGDLSQRTEAAAASLEQQAAAMEEIASVVATSAERVASASALSEKNRGIAQHGASVTREINETMQGINDSSRKISDIIGVIDGIAFQTNILALNAAVEAARAGEQGRGFAVVAGEVRALAQRSAEAAREIKQLISESVSRVEAGAHVVSGSVSTMEELQRSAEQVNALLQEISNAAREQSSGVEQVGSAIQSLDRETQQNAALVEEMSSASMALNQQAQLLQAEIANFRVV